ncbi:MAG: hypothetical protein JNK08_09265 [Sediminibacterium sp.]|nr:hypothetical protein [Sediminibacterium sp.]
MSKNVRGAKLDESLKLELEKMILEGYHLSPISRSAMVKRLGIKSRSTLLLNSRSILIANAAAVQLEQAGLNSAGKNRRNTAIEQNAILQLKIDKLTAERDALVEKIAMIINGCQAKGYNIEEIMLPLRMIR